MDVATQTGTEFDYTAVDVKDDTPKKRLEIYHKLLLENWSEAEKRRDEKNQLIVEKINYLNQRAALLESELEEIKDLYEKLYEERNKIAIKMPLEAIEENEDLKTLAVRRAEGGVDLNNPLNQVQIDGAGLDDFREPACSHPVNSALGASALSATSTDDGYLKVANKMPLEAIEENKDLKTIAGRRAEGGVDLNNPLNQVQIDRAGLDDFREPAYSHPVNSALGASALSATSTDDGDRQCTLNLNMIKYRAFMKNYARQLFNQTEVMAEKTSLNCQDQADSVPSSSTLNREERNALLFRQNSYNFCFYKQPSTSMPGEL